MRKCMLAAALCAAAIVVAPVASASAASVTGACHISGEATFVPGLSKTPQQVTYSFEGAAKCKEAGGGEKTGTTKVSGKALLQCAVAAGGIEVVGETGAPGTGTLLNGEDSFELSFVAQAGIVDLLAREAGTKPYTATGAAQFLTTNGPEAIVKCAQSSLGGLKFEAETAGTI